MKVKIAKFGATMAALGGLAMAANGDVAYNSFGENDTYDIFGYGIGGNYQLGAGIAMQFVSATTGFVTLIKLALESSYNYDVSINADANGLPGQALETWTNVPGQGGTTLEANLSVYLAAGHLYWVAVQPGEGGSAKSGQWDDGDGVANYYINDNGGAWRGPIVGPPGAYRVETQAVPEPESGAVLIVGAATVAMRRRRR